VLVVDDEPAIRALVAKIVERAGFGVDVAADGADAIEKVNQTDYAVIVLDLMMPRVDGFGVLEHLEKYHPEKLGCTIIASAMPENEIMKRLNLPVYRIHAKPFDMGRLIDDIRACTAG
jgi:DNA-binding response OmpR family regulator